MEKALCLAPYVAGRTGSEKQRPAGRRAKGDMRGKFRLCDGQRKAARRA